MRGPFLKTVQRSTPAEDGTRTNYVLYAEVTAPRKEKKNEIMKRLDLENDRK